MDSNRRLVVDVLEIGVPWGLFLVLFDLHRFKVFGLENLAAIQALDVVHAVAPGDDLGTGMVTNGLHTLRFR
jgi:hypothetical protein